MTTFPVSKLSSASSAASLLDLEQIFEQTIERAEARYTTNCSKGMDGAQALFITQMEILFDALHLGLENLEILLDALSLQAYTWYKNMITGTPEEVARERAGIQTEEWLRKTRLLLSAPKSCLHSDGRLNEKAQCYAALCAKGTRPKRALRLAGFSRCSLWTKR